ncbi:hypothetical protein BJV78DRAFT_805031 [Lactifluus subvellereus]|nr:hypothetical protein BJV78DRAFT_805031 [Lactifluus subvellereus]
MRSDFFLPIRRHVPGRGNAHAVLADELRSAFVQPALLAGAKLKDYQLQGVV